MTISVIIPARNAEATIEDLLRALVSQHRPPDELIIVDNQSSDSTVDKVKEFIRHTPSISIAVETEPRKGPSAARNRGAARAEGSILAFIDADAIPPPDWLQTVHTELSGEGDVVCGPYRERDTATFIRAYLDVMQRARARQRSVFIADVHNNQFLLGGNFAIQKKLFFEIGGFDERMRLGEDIDLSKRLYRSGRVIVFTPAMAVTHCHQESFGGRFKKAFTYGLLQPKFLAQYAERALTIVLFGNVKLRMPFPVKIKLYACSLLTIALCILLLSLFHRAAAIMTIIAVLFCILGRVFQLIIKAQIRVSLFRYAAFTAYWILERLFYDAGKLWGSLIYRQLCM